MSFSFCVRPPPVDNCLNEIERALDNHQSDDGVSDRLSQICYGRSEINDDSMIDRKFSCYLSRHKSCIHRVQKKMLRFLFDLIDFPQSLGPQLPDHCRFEFSPIPELEKRARSPGNLEQLNYA